MADAASWIDFEGVEFGACGTQVAARLNGVARGYGDYEIVDDAAQHVQADTGGRVDLSGITVTLTGTPAFTTFANAKRLGSIVADGTTYSGAATGARYSATLNGIIDTNGAGATALPGDSAGATATGGQYA